MTTYNNGPYFVATWHRALRGAAATSAQAHIKRIDPTMELVFHSAAGNDIRMWLERPNDGTNNEHSRSARNAACVAAINAALAGR